MNVSFASLNDDSFDTLNPEQKVPHFKDNILKAISL